MQGAQVWSLVGELRSHMLCGTAKKKKTKLKSEKKKERKKKEKLGEVQIWKLTKSRLAKIKSPKVGSHPMCWDLSIYHKGFHCQFQVLCFFTLLLKFLTKK